MHLSLLQVQKGDGGGLSLQQDDMKLNDSQFRAPHTGILYTPPKPPGLWLLQTLLYPFSFLSRALEVF